MYKQLLPFMVLLQLSTQSHAVDLNNTAEIISQASEATENLQEEINTVIIEVPIIEESTTIEELPQTEAVDIPIVNEPIIPVTIIDNNQTMEENTLSETVIPIQTEELIEMEEPVIISENNISIIEEIVPTQELENNTTIPTTGLSIITEVVETNSTSQETNTTLNKETFDMSQGDADKGKKIFIHTFKDVCEIKGQKFAEKHSQDEWEELAEEGKFEQRVFELCPKIELTYQKEWSSDLYQFYYENANDSEHIPEF